MIHAIEAACFFGGFAAGTLFLMILALWLGRKN